MKRIAFPLMGVVLLAGVASAQAPYPNTATSRSAKATVSRSQSNRMKAEVVSTDVQAKTITLKTDSGEKTMKVEGRAVRNLKKLKAGEEVWFTSRDQAGREAVVSLRPARTHTASTSKTHHHNASKKY